MATAPVPVYPATAEEAGVPEDVYRSVTVATLMAANRWDSRDARTCLDHGDHVAVLAHAETLRGTRLVESVFRGPSGTFYAVRNPDRNRPLPCRMVWDTAGGVTEEHWADDQEDLDALVAAGWRYESDCPDGGVCLPPHFTDVADGVHPRPVGYAKAAMPPGGYAKVRAANELVTNWLVGSGVRLYGAVLRGLPEDGELVEVDSETYRDSNETAYVFRHPSFTGTREQPQEVVPHYTRYDWLERFLSLVPRARLIDLAARSAAHALTAAEELAFRVIAGETGDGHDPPVQQLIDECVQQFAGGAYRVPVRVVADKSRVRVAVTPVGGEDFGGWTDGMREALYRNLRVWLDGDRSRILMLPFPCRLDVFEVGPADAPPAPANGQPLPDPLLD